MNSKKGSTLSAESAGNGHARTQHRSHPFV